MEIILFAVIAGILIARLNSVLGQKNEGDEVRRPNPLARTGQSERGETGKVIPMPGRGEVIDVNLESEEDFPLSVEAQIQRLRAIDPSFDEDHFVNGAKVAFPMVVEAFARGDKETLASLLDDGIYRDFESAIDQRGGDGEAYGSEIAEVADVSIIEARLKQGMLEVTVRIISEQVTEASRQQAANDGGKGKPATVEVIDVWTFTRPANSGNPNWKLVETRIEP